VLFPDTFTNRFQPQIGRAAVAVLEHSGWQVVVPQGHICCGRPLYDYGFLDLARRYLRRTLRQLRGWYRAGIPVVGLEPSCLAVLKDELVKLLPDDEDAQLLCASARHFAEFVQEFDVELPQRSGTVLLWGHCHQKATGGVDADRAVLEAVGLDVRSPGGGCCGQAGSWGFERDHYDVSMTIAEHSLVPALAAADDLVVANGFSCRSQITHVAPSAHPLHLAEVLRAAV
jgi:Fe-S oxidoreductase